LKYYGIQGPVNPQNIFNLSATHVAGGLPDGKVYIIYSRFYEINFNNSGLEFVFAVHEEFLFDYKNEKLLTVTPLGQPINTVLVDKPEPKIKILKVYRNVNTYSQAQKLLNEIAHKMNCFPASA
jgi:hypothetical protein